MDIDKMGALRGTELFRELDPDGLRAVADSATAVHLARGEILFVEGAPATGLYVVVDGSVRAFRTSPEGREQTIHVERSGSTIAEVPVFDGGTYPSTVVADTPATLLLIARERMLRLCLERPAVALGALRVLATRLRNCASLVETLSLRDVGQRVARWLAAEARTAGEEGPEGLGFDLRVSREEMASRLGTVREVVSRALSRLQQERIIIVRGRRIVVTDSQRLAAYARDGAGAPRKP